jgi:site-specific DNA-methyltransferase (adenine-specific)
VNKPVVIGNAVLYLGDCLEILPTLGKVDAVVTDPPYDEGTHKNARTNNRRRDSENYSDGGRSLIDFPALTAPFPLLCDALVSLSKTWVVMTCSHQHAYSIFDHPAYVRLGCWVKSDPMPQISGDRPGQGHESVVLLHGVGKKQWNGGGRPATWSGQILKGGAEFVGIPTQKPLWLINSFVSLFSNSGDEVLDPFMGSGTTGVSCAGLNRRFVGIEVDSRRFDIACERIENAQRQERLFD